MLTAGPIKQPPLDIPEYATISHSCGQFTHSGEGLMIRHNNTELSGHKWRFVTGVLLEQLTGSDCRFEYQLTLRINTGAVGMLEYCGSNDLVTPFIAGQYHDVLSSRFLLLPWFAFGVPLPAAEMSTLMTDPGLDLTDESNRGYKIGIGD